MAGRLSRTSSELSVRLPIHELDFEYLDRSSVLSGSIAIPRSEIHIFFDAVVQIRGIQLLDNDVTSGHVPDVSLQDPPPFYDLNEE